MTATRLSFAACAALCCLTTPPATAVDPATPFRDYELQHWSVEHGLPQISVLSLTQDAHGYLWIGTQDGVSRFDGLRFVTFDRERSGVDTSYGSAVLVDAADRVWFGTPRGAVRIEGGVVTEFAAIDAKLTVNALALDADGAPLFATARGILRADGAVLEPHLLAGIPVHSLLHDGQALWAGSNGALLRVVDGVSERIETPRAARVTQLIRSSAGLILGTNAGVYRFDPARRSFDGPLAETGGQATEALLLDRAGNLWIGTSSALLRLAPDGRTERIAEDVFDGRPWIMALFEDRDANLWIGARRESLYRARDGALRMRSVADGLDDPMVWSVLSDGDGVLVGTNSGFSRLSADGRFTRVATRGRLPQATVYDLARDDDALWLGTRSGLARLERGVIGVPAALATLASKQITGVLEVADDDIWIGTLEGLYRLRGGALETLIAAEGVAVNRVRCLLARGPDELWVGTQDGVRVVRGREVTRPEWAAPFDGHFVSRLLALPDGRVIVATVDSGIGVLAGTRMTLIDKARGLPSNSAVALDLVGDHLYVSSLDGLWRIPLAALPDLGSDAPTRVAAEIIAGSDNRDLSVRGFACCNGGAQARSAQVDRFLFYPTTDGVVRLDTAAVRRPPGSPSAMVESLTHAMETRHGDRRFEIVGKDRDLRIDYTAVTFVRAFALEFRYMLEGYDEDWVEAGERRSAFYSQLPHGDHRFVVQARVPNGAWGEQSAPLEISITPEWHERLLVRALGVLLLLGLVAASWRGRLAQMQARTDHLERVVTERTRDLARANERLRVANQTLALENQTDALTGLYNRRFVLNNAFRRGGVARANDRCAVQVIEVDEFKRINEEHGQGSGDRVLIDLGQVLSGCVRGGDIVARWTGVSFLLVLPGLDESGALELADRLRRRIAEHQFHADDDAPLRISASIGFAHHLPRGQDDDGAQLTLDLTDAALQRSKRLGRNRVTGLRRVSAQLPSSLTTAEVESAVADGTLAWVEITAT